MSDFPRFNYSMNEVRRAGEILAHRLDARSPHLNEALGAFRIANNWRDAHAFPMRSIRAQTMWYLSAMNISGVTGARLKRMQAIRRKIRRIGLNLNQFQDLGGVRAILPSVDDVNRLAVALRTKTRHDVRKENDYIQHPKEKDGYRSLHIMFSYQGRGEAEVYTGRRIEMQIRTRLQHSWATAVEAVGLFRGENLKGSDGDECWLRLFKLMSAEFALSEGSPDIPGLGDRRLRLEEIKSLNADLSAIDTLDNLSFAVRWTEIAVSAVEKPRYYLVKYDLRTNSVEVRPYFSTNTAVASYDIAENYDNQNDKDTTNVVLVESEKLIHLKQAYPNYFGDVQMFKINLKRIIGGETARDYDLKPQETVGIVKRGVPDLSWFYARKRWR